MTLKQLAEKIKAKDRSKMMFFAMSKNEAEELCREIEERTRPEPRCPSCGSRVVQVESVGENQHYVYCDCENKPAGPSEATIDAALEHWRPAKDPQNTSI